ncbi:hypothetical protein SEVIR_4G071401v4 [Setaria viridis]
MHNMASWCLLWLQFYESGLELQDAFAKMVIAGSFSFASGTSLHGSRPLATAWLHNKIPGTPSLPSSNTPSPHHTPPATPYTVEVASKDVSPLEPDTPEDSSAWKRLLPGKKLMATSKSRKSMTIPQKKSGL